MLYAITVVSFQLKGGSGKTPKIMFSKYFGLYKVNIRSRLNGLGGILHGVEVGGLASSVFSLEVDLRRLSCSYLGLVLLVALCSLNNVVTAFRREKVGHRHVYLLLDNSTVHLTAL